MTDVLGRLTAADLPALVTRLGFRGADVEAVLASAGAVTQSQPDLERVTALVGRLLPLIGQLDSDTENPLELPGPPADHLGVGVLPLLALLVTAPDVARFHAGRGIAEEVSWASLADLGQQAWVHRQTYGEFGLHTYGWMRIAWSGALYWLGRLQFNLQRDDGGWVLSTHIPATGPLAPAAADDSFRQARDFFARHFADYPTADFHCASWLLDPDLAAALPADSNMAKFQRRWRLYGEPMRGDGDVLFFTFFRRGDVDLATLPQRTTLQRVIVDRLRSGGHWNVWQGRLSQSAISLAPSSPLPTPPPTTAQPAPRPPRIESQP